MPAKAYATTQNLVSDPVLHELRRALPQPIYRIHKGEAAAAHEIALAQGWLVPAPPLDRTGQPARLALSDRGLQILAAHQSRHGLK